MVKSRPKRQLKLLGQQFGKLKVIGQVEFENVARSHWLCACDCGNTVVLKGELLTKKIEPRRSCGCGVSKVIDMTGEQYGRLTVLELVKTPGARRPDWLCQCTCGNTTLVKRAALVHGLTTSCGCFAKERASEVGKARVGEKHHLYNPDITQERRSKERKTTAYYYWRLLVYGRDNYICQVCRVHGSGNLVAHHLNSYRAVPELQTQLHNGITLCETCHKLYHHIFGQRGSTEEKFTEFIDILWNITAKPYPEHKKTQVYLREIGAIPRKRNRRPKK